MSFEDVMMKRLADCHAEVCDEILASMKAGRSLSDAVMDVIEVLPASKTRDLRRWVADWEAYGDWLALKKAGWRVKRIGREFVDVFAPPSYDLATIMEHGDPPLAAIAAAAGVREVLGRHIAWTRASYGRGKHAYVASFEVVD